jgi:hypothetical protein
VGRVSLVLAKDLSDQTRTVWATRANSDEVLLLQLARRAQVPAETAVFDRWFYVTSFIAQVVALGFARVVIKAKRDILYMSRSQAYTIDQLW